LINTAVILAGGFGTRLRSVVSEVPKPMAPINGKPFLEILINYWIIQGVNNFILSVGYKHEIIENHFGNNYRNLDIKYLVEESPLGTGGALIKAISNFKIEQPFLLLNGDTYFEVSLESLEAFHNLKKSAFTFSVFKSNNLERYLGLNVNDEMQVLPVESKEVGNESKFVNGGVYIIDPSIININNFEMDHFYSFENDILPEIMKEHPAIYACEFDTTFIDIGVPEDYFKANKIL
jgi:D-glycero-alpha-D-manno-heptose 1-phosphate guanylyltransferase